MQKSNGTKVRKLPLPLRLKLGTDGAMSDGLFTLTSKEASEINIVAIDGEGYVSLEIHPPLRELKSSSANLLSVIKLRTKIGVEASKSRGQGKDFGQYVYYRNADSTYVAEVQGESRNRAFNLGSIRDQSSIIYQIAVSIIRNFGTGKFSKKTLTEKLPKNLGYGQILKSVLDIMTIEGYLQRTEGSSDGKAGRIREWFDPTDKLTQVVVVANPEQA